MFMRKKVVVKSASDNSRSDGRNVQYGGSGGHGSDFGQRGNPIPTRIGNFLPRHHGGNPPPSSHGGNLPPSSRRRNHSPSSFGGNVPSSHYGDYNQDRGSNFNSQREGNTHSSGYQYGHNASSVNPNRRENAPYGDPAGESSSRYLDYVNPHSDQGRRRRRDDVDLEKTALGILNEVLAKDPNLQVQKNPSYASELDVDRYGGRSQSYGQDYPMVGNQEYPSQYELSDPRYDNVQGSGTWGMGSMQPPDRHRMGYPEYPTSYQDPDPSYYEDPDPSYYEDPDPRHDRQGPPPFNMGNVDNNVRPPQMGGMVSIMEFDPYGNIPQEHGQGWDQGMELLPRKRPSGFAEPPDNKKPRGSVISRLGPSVGDAGVWPGKGAAGNRKKLNPDDGTMYPSKTQLYKDVQGLGLRLSPDHIKGIGSGSLKRLAMKYTDFPREALHCRVCEKKSFRSVFDYLKHGSTENHTKRQERITHLGIETFTYLSMEAQVAYARTIGPWNPSNPQLCKLCKVPDRSKRGDHSELQECWVVHQYARPIGCCNVMRLKGRLEYESHRLSFGHLKTEYLYKVNARQRDEREKEELEKLKEKFKEGSHLNDDTVKFRNPLLEKERKVFQQFGETEVPKEVVNLIHACGTEEKTFFRRKLNPKRFKFDHYKPSVPQGVDEVIFVTDIFCVVCCTTVANSKQDILDHCSTKEHYDNIVKKRSREQKVTLEDKEASEKGENKVTTKKEKENIKEEGKENIKEEGKENIKEEGKENVKEEGKEGTVEGTLGKSKWTRGEDTEVEDDVIDINDDPYEGKADFLDQEGYAEEEVDGGKQEIDGGGDDVRMDDLEDKVEEFADEKDEPNDKKGGADKSKDDLSVPVNPEVEETEVVDLPKEEEANKDGAQLSGEEKQAAKPGLTLRKKKTKFHF